MTSLQHHILYLSTRLPPTSTLFPYTTLFRSHYDHCRAQQFIEYSEGGRPACQNRIRNWPVSKPFIRLTRTGADRKSTRLNSSHVATSYAVFCLKKKKPKTPCRTTAG